MSGIYIHIPFCKQACHYCNFHFSTSILLKKEMINAIGKEIALAPYYEGASSEVTSIYFGGGTPSLLNKDELNLVMDALHNKFKINPLAEITLEANPDDINIGKLNEWKAIGVNRLSVGIQSFLQSELEWMNRAHSAADALHCITQIKEAGFTDFSIDLIYGSPLLSNEDFKKNVDIIIEQNVPHISCYALTVEPSTALHKMIEQHKKLPVETEKQAAQFLLLMQWMEEAGYEHYEISNFAKPGMRSKHNSSYWQGAKYYGFGPSAHSYDGSRRMWNISNNALYIQSLKNNAIPAEEEILTSTQQLNEYIMTGLRTIEGLNLQTISKMFGSNYSDKLLQQSEKWQTGEKMIRTDAGLALTREGKLFADGIAADLFF